MIRSRTRLGARPRVRGFTIVELVVSLAIIGVLTAILVPAVQSARGAARLTQCAANLHQIGIAATCYEGTHRVFPGAPLLSDGITEWYVTLLPFLEQTGDAPIVPVYVCASDVFGTGRLQIGMCYHICDGVVAKQADGFARSGPGRCVRAQDITDGLSNTAAFSEKLAWPSELASVVYPPEMFPEHWIRRQRTTAAFISDLDQFADHCRDHALYPTREWVVVWGYNHVITPNQNSCFNGPDSGLAATLHWAVTATSGHSDGVNVAFADGSVRFVSNSIDRLVWRAAGTRGGNETNVAF